MTNQKSEAQRLARQLREGLHVGEKDLRPAADELLRLEAQVKQLLGEKEQLRCSLEAQRMITNRAIEVAKIPAITRPGQAYEQLQAKQRQQQAQVTWPVARDVGRFGDMSPKAFLRVGLDADNDVYVSVWDDDGGGSVEFCCPGAGGGKSSGTRVALINLMAAMEADNAETPAFDWWKQSARGSDATT